MVMAMNISKNNKYDWLETTIYYGNYTVGVIFLNTINEKEIRTKGGGTWRPNKPKTIEAKRKSKNPVIRSHAKDIYIAEEKILKSLTGFIEKRK